MDWRVLLLFYLVSLSRGIDLKKFLMNKKNFISPQNEGKIWAFLAATSQGYYNYRHQADVCHAYQILHENGIPDENIIVMMPDDIANDPKNPTPGIIINEPGGRNVYQGVPKDYTNETVTANNFLNILSGNKEAMKGIRSGRVIESGPDDYIFVNFVDHGGPGILCFGLSDVLTAGDLVKTLTLMAEQNKFKKMIIYIEACHSGSMFDDILPDDLNIIIMTAADPHENSFACYYDTKRETYLGDVFSVTWMHDAQHESLPAETMHHQFEKVRTWTNTSHVEEYGDLDIGTTKVSQFLGFRMRYAGTTTFSNGLRETNGPRITDTVSNMDVPIEVMNRRIENTKNETARKELKLRKHHMLKLRRSVDSIFEKIVKYLSGDNEDRIAELSDEKYTLGRRNLDCYSTILKRFTDKCFNVAKHPYVRYHLHKLINMCSARWVTTSNALDAISNVCHINTNLGAKVL